MPAEQVGVLDRIKGQESFSPADIPGFGKKESLPDISLIDNERTNTNISILEPLCRKDEFNPLFSYLSRTRQLEIETAKTEYLQGIADRMTQNTDIKSRVVVMRKGKRAEAFCTGDGTIFLSQSLIDSFGSVDEVAAVIAHEANHLLNHTSQKASKTWNKLGVSWVHELTADAQAPSLLEKAGFNSLAFASAIEKLSGFERGIEHQGGITRASESIGTHFGIDRRTSAQAFLEKPALLLEQTKLSNFELFIDFHKMKDRKKAAEILERLHPQDLINAYQELSVLQSWELIKDKKDLDRHNIVVDEDEKEIALQKKAASEIRKLLAEQGATGDEQAVVLMCATPTNLFSLSTNTDKRRFSEINDPDKIRDLAHLISKHDERVRLTSLCRKATFPDTVYIASFYGTLEENLFDPFSTPKARGIPVSEESLLDALVTFTSMPSFDIVEGRIAKIITAYIRRSNVRLGLENANSSSSDKAKIQAFLKKVRERKILRVDEVNDLKHEIVQSVKFRDHAGRIYSLEHDDSKAKFIDEVFSDMRFKEEEVEPFFRDLKDYPANEIQNKLQHFFLQISNSFWQRRTEGKETLENEKLQIARKIMKELKKDERFSPNHGHLRYGIYAAEGIFSRDSEQFYTFMDEIAPPDQLVGVSPELAFSLLKPIFEKKYSNSSKNRLISNFDRFSKFPIVQLALEHSLCKSESIESLGQLEESIDRSDSRDISKTFFEDSIAGLILGREYRRKLLELTQKDTPTDDLNILYECLKLTYPDGPEKTHLLRAISKKFLVSPDVSFEDKLLHLQQHIDGLGPEGLSLLAEQIEDIETYRKFRTAMQKSLGEYLSGKTVTLKVAALDIVSSFFVKDFEKLLDLCRNDPDIQAKSSTDFAERWIGEAIDFGYRVLGSTYDPDTDKFLIEEEGRQTFRTAAELIDTFHDLTTFERFAIAHKALTEQNGAFSSEKNRKILFRQIIDALQIKNRFIREALRSVCQEGDAKFLAFPASRMLGPLLFRSLDKAKINIEEMSNSFFRIEGRRRIKDLPSGNSILKALSSGRRDVSAFGSNYRNYPDTPFFRLSKESDEQFRLFTQRLHEMFDEPSQNGEEKEASEINPSLDAIIKGVEGGGALGVRSLQLAVQMHEFSEPVRRRLSESFDQNPGLNKLLFWENLYKLSEEDPKIREFVQRLRLKDYLGGGSQYTTFEAVVDDNGKERRVALKMLNPNSEAFLKEGHSIAQTVLEDVRKQGGDMRKLADMGLVLTDLAHQWCLKDINDQTFVEDDDEFREVVEGFNSRGKGAGYVVPERVFNTYNLKAEDLALGRTVNKVLNDGQVPAEVKQKLVKRMSEFFTFQLKGPKIQEEEQAYALVHSDPHIGNYIVDIENPNMPIAVIDRHMYLKLEGQDIFVLEQFIAGDDLKFLSALTERVLDINKVSNRVERTVATARVKSALMSTYFSQKFRGKVDKFSLLRTALSEFQKRGIDVPLNLRLMIRNIQAFKNLTDKYGLNFEDIYKNFNP